MSHELTTHSFFMIKPSQTNNLDLKNRFLNYVKYNTSQAVNFADLVIQE